MPQDRGGCIVATAMACTDRLGIEDRDGTSFASLISVASDNHAGGDLTGSAER